MKKLYIVRHAQKENELLEQDDYDRELSPEGIQDAQNMAKFFALKNLHIDLIVASPAARTKKTADSFFSATPEELKAIVDGTKLVKKAIGEISYPIVSLKDQRSLIIVKDVKKGEILTSNNVRSIRPGGGLKSSEIDKILNRKASKNLTRGTLLKWEMVGELSE